MHEIRTLSQADAQFAIASLSEEIARRGDAAVIAVADMRGELLAFLRMDGASIASGQIAQNKAFTAARLERPSKDVGTRVRALEDGHDISFFGDPRYIGWGGGIPVMWMGSCIGAVAVSGLPEADDIALCQAAVDRLVARLG
jgi:glc operon protein GlcG